ncbi:MAG: CoA transferase [Pseudomonadota bacterium]
MTPPLQGVRVLDLTNVLAGPFCCHQLAHLGAEVVKVEAPGRGDLARTLGGDEALNAAGMGASFLAQNAGKRSIAVDFKTEAGRETLRRLVRAADVLVENFRPGVMRRLGLGPEALRVENPRLIYCAISGFGQTGPWIERPAYDQIVQGAAGVMSVTGDPDGPPTRAGYPVADTAGGLTAAMAICAALNARPRGCVLDVSMLEATLATLGWAVSEHLVCGEEPRRRGNDNVTASPSGAFETADGLLNIAANKDDQWRALCGHLEREDLLDHPDYADRALRKKNRAPLKAALEETLRARPAREWEAELNALSVPAGAVLTVPQILAEPQLQGRGFLETFEDVPGVDRPVSIAGIGVKIDGQAPRVAAPPPALDQHGEEILAELGFSPEEIAALRPERGS